MKRYNALNLLKMVAIIGILFHHYQLFTGYRFSGELLGIDLTPFSFFDGYFYFGYLVELFLGISGFFAASYITRIRDGLPFRDFYVRKVLRFMPMMAICGGIFVAALEFYHHIVPDYAYNTWCFFDRNMDLYTYLTSVLALNYGGAFVVDNAVNAVTWNISVIMICYAWLYVLVILSERLRINVRYLFIMMILIGISVHEYGINLPYFNDYSARGYMAFFSGVLLNMYFSKNGGFLLKFPVRVVLSVLVFIGAVTSSEDMELFAIIEWPMVISVFVDPVVESKFKNEKYWKFIGDMEFGTYLWHPIVGIIWCCLSFVFSFKGHSIFYMMTYLIVCMTFGMCSYIMIEKPIQERIKMTCALRRQER